MLILDLTTFVAHFKPDSTGVACHVDRRQNKLCSAKVKADHSPLLEPARIRGPPRHVHLWELDVNIDFAGLYSSQHSSNFQRIYNRVISVR